MTSYSLAEILLFKKIRFGFKIEGPSGEKENAMARSNKLRAILLPPMTYQFYHFFPDLFSSGFPIGSGEVWLGLQNGGDTDSY